MSTIFNNTLNFNTKNYNVGFVLRSPNYVSKYDNSIQTYLPSRMFHLMVVPIDKMYIKNTIRYYYYMNYKEAFKFAFWNPEK
jgi:hypothetical protein